MTLAVCAHGEEKEGQREVEIGLAFSLGREEHLEMICMSVETCGGRCDGAISARLGF
jgi:hypothetical protein